MPDKVQTARQRVSTSEPVQRFGDIIEKIEKIERFSAGMDRESFAGNGQAVLAVKYALLS
jgi:uncharacterized protein with HEPN domain